MKIQISKKHLISIRNIRISTAQGAELVYFDGIGLVENEANHSDNLFVAAGRFLVRELSRLLTSYNIPFTVTE